VALVLAVVALRSPAIEAEVRARVVALVADATGARVSLGRFALTLPLGVQAADVALTFPAGARVSAAELSGAIALPGLLAGRIDVGTVRLRGVRARLVPTASEWGFDDFSETQDETPFPTLRVRRVVVEDGRVVVPPWRVGLSNIALDAGFAMDPDTIRVSVASLTGVPRGVALSPLSARGDVTVAATGDTLDLEEVDLATRRTRLTGDAHIAFDRRLRAHLDAAPLSARELHALVAAVGLRADVSGTVDARGPWQRIAVRSALQTPASGTARVFGVLDLSGTDLPYRAQALVRRLDLAAIDGTLPASTLTGRVRARGALATLDAPPLALQLRLAPSIIAGTRLDGARFAGHLRSDQVAARGVVAAPGGRVTVDGRLGWTGEEHYQGRVRARVDDLAALAPGVRGRGRVSATVEGHGFDSTRRTATVHARLGRGQIEGVRYDAGTADLTLRGDLLALGAASVTRKGVRAGASGTLDVRRETLDASGTVAGPLSDVPAGDVAGTMSVRATVRGPLRALAIEASGTAEQLRSGTTSAEHAAFAAALTGVGGDTPAGRATLDLTRLRPGTGAPWTGTGAADWRRTAGIDTAVVSLSGHAEDGAQLATRGTIRRPAAGAIAVELAELALAPADQPTWTLAAPAKLTVAGSAVAVDRLELTAGAQHVSVSGRAGLSGPADATLDWRDVDLTSLCGLRGLECAGRSAGTARLTGAAAAPRLSLSLRADDVTVERSPVTAIALSGDYADRALALRGTVTQSDAGRLDVAGSVPVDLAWDGPRRDLSNAPIELALRTDGLDLAIVRAFAPDTIREISGRLTADLRVSGPWNDLRADGPLGLDGGRLALYATGVTYEDITLDAVARGQTIEIETVRTRAGEGTLEGGGTMALVATRTTPFALQLQFRNFLAVALPAYEAATDGTLTVEGTLAYPVVRGALTLTRLLVRPTVLTETSGPSLEPDPTIEVVGLPTSPTARAPEQPATPDLAESLSLDVRARVVRDAWIRRTDADVELRGELHLAKAAYGPLFVIGEIRLERGWYAFQGRRFEVDEGRIVFGSDVPPDPQLDITALNKTGEYEVTVKITGRASEPALALSSSPPLEQADILALLVFGRPARDLGKQESVDLQKQAISLASGYVMPELRQSVLNTLGLDTFEAGAEGVRAGRYVTRDVFITLAQDFTGRAGQTMGVEYSITRRFSLKLSTSTQGTSAVDLLWRRRY
jgi:autotransporter translocation and assembly factor TamB